MTQNQPSNALQKLEWKLPIVLFLILRFGLWGWMFLVRRLLPFPIESKPELYMGVAAESNPWLEVWQRWDVLHYQAIAERGYQAFDTALFTPPLLPLLMRGISAFLGGNTLLAGLIVSSLFCLAGMMAFYQLAYNELGNERAAQRALLYLGIFPTAFFLFAPYTESIFMLGSVLCLTFLRQKKWLWAGAWGGLAAFARSTGGALLIPALWEAWGEWKTARSLRVWFAPATIFVVTLIPSLYAAFGMEQSPLAPFHALTVRSHGWLTFPGLNLIAAVRQIWTGQYVSANVSDLIFTVSFLALGYPVLKTLPRLYGIYYLTYMGIYLIRVSDVYPLLSMTRYVLALIPAFLILARWGENPKIHRIILYLFLLGLLFYSAQYAIWGWAG